METMKEQSSVNTGKSKLRYPLRSANKVKDDKLAMADGAAASSVPKRVKPTSNVRQSVSAPSPSTKDKSASRRLSVPTKTTRDSLPRSTGSITPISESRLKIATNAQQKNETAVSDVRKTTPRKKFSIISSASYWLSQIKISESASKHSISLGFFKLALESGCEPLQRMCDELKSYARRHNLIELGEPAKELFRSYNILEDIEQVQVSETCSQVPEELIRTSDEDVQNSSSTASIRELKSRSLNTKNVRASSTAESAKKLSTQSISPSAESGKKPSTQKISPSNKKHSVTRNSMKSKSVADNGGNAQKKSERSSRQAAKKEKVNTTKNQGKKSASEKDPVGDLPSMETEQEDKENKETQQPEEIIRNEVI